MLRSPQEGCGSRRQQHQYRQQPHNPHSHHQINISGEEQLHQEGEEKSSYIKKERRRRRRRRRRGEGEEKRRSNTHPIISIVIIFPTPVIYPPHIMLFRSLFFSFSRFPKIRLHKQLTPGTPTIHIINRSECLQIIPRKHFSEFLKNDTLEVITSPKPNVYLKTYYYSTKAIEKIPAISKDITLAFSDEVKKQGPLKIAVSIIMKAYEFSRKGNRKVIIGETIGKNMEKIGEEQPQEKEDSLQSQRNQGDQMNQPLNSSTQQIEEPKKNSLKYKSKSESPIIYLKQFENYRYAIELAKSQMRAAEWSNARGDQANIGYFLRQAERICLKYPSVRMTTFKGKELLSEGFRLMHAVGRGSAQQPLFISLQFTNNPTSKKYTALLGKGICFDTGGYNLKSSAGITDMHIDKHGAASVLSAFESVLELNLPINVVANMGFAQNMISSTAYRPMDIIKSLKGLTVEINNTDAEGRLVLADCMQWIQKKYDLHSLIELSTLTGAIVMALGKQRAGLFSNCQQLIKRIKQSGNQVGEQVWNMPVDQYHVQLIKSKSADLTNSSGKPQGGSSQAAAFLLQFVEKRTRWAHIDIAGTAMGGKQGTKATGYGAKLLIQYLKESKDFTIEINSEKEAKDEERLKKKYQLMKQIAAEMKKRANPTKK